MKKRCFFGLGVCFLVACSSSPLASDLGGAGAGGAVNSGSAGSAGSAGASMCTAARATALGAVDSVSTGAVSVVSSSAGVTTLYVDATAGGMTDAATNPWTFVSLDSGSKVEVTDLSSVESTAWDLALKRSQIYTNSGDGGPGRGGAVLLDNAFDAVTSADADGVVFTPEKFFDGDCNPNVEMLTGALYTSFVDWYAYDENTHVLTPSAGTYLVHGGTGKLYELAFENYYATPSGGTGNVSAAYLLKYKAL